MFKKHSFPLLAIIIIASSFLTSMAIVAKLNGGSILKAAGGGSYASGYTAGVDATKKKLTESGMFPSISEIKTISGAVKSVGNNQLVITVGRVSPNPLDEQGPSERTVKVTGDTKITVKIPMTAAERDAAMNTYNENMKAGKPATPPNPYTDKQAALSDITVGTVVTVTAADNIKDAATIVATAIDFVNAPAAMPIITPTPVPTVPSK